MEGMIGEIRMFAGNFAPKSWAFCSGQIVNISSNTALFSILGTTYGGNGTTNFALPDLRGRMAVGAGNAPNLQPMPIGQKGGAETVTLTTNNVPPHTHVGAGTFTGSYTMKGSEDAGGNSPSGNFPATPSFQTYGTDNELSMGASPITGSITATISPAGGGLPFSVVGPYIAIYYVICQYGIFPSRN